MPIVVEFQDELQVIPKQIKLLLVTIMADKRKRLLTSIPTQVLSDGNKQRYITSPTKILTAQKILGVIVMINPVMLEPLAVTVPDSKPKPPVHIHDVDIACIPLKPSWSLVSLADNSCNGDSATRIYFWICLSFNGDGVTAQPRSPWPPLFSSKTLLVGNTQGF
jgi:hypothetical protein